MSKQHISKIESGARVPGGVIARQLAAALGISTSELLDDPGAEQPAEQDIYPARARVLAAMGSDSLHRTSKRTS